MTQTGTRTKAVEATIVDDYDLQPGELTKAMVAGKDYLNCTERTIENLKAKGKLPAVKASRRIDGEIKKVLIFQEADVLQYKSDQATGKDVEPSAPGNALQTMPGGKDFQTAALLHLINRADGISDRGEQFVTTETVITEYGLCEAELHRLEKEKLLRRFAGPNGKAKWSRRQIEAL